MGKNVGIAAKAPPGSRGAVGRCDTCSLLLPLRPPAANEKPAKWICTGCGERYSGVLIESLPREFTKNVRRATPAPVEAVVDEGDLRDELSACPTLPDPAVPHPITIAFPDRPRIICKQENSLSLAIDNRIKQAAALQLPPQQSPFAENLQNLETTGRTTGIGPARPWIT